MEGIALANKQLEAVAAESPIRIVGRLTREWDLFEGMREVCKEHGIEAAQFQCIGSLQHATYVQVERDGTEGRIRYSDKKQTTSPVELLSATGFIGKDETGALDVHMHGVFVDCDGVISGGHFLADENPVAVTIEYILYPLNNVQMERKRDAIWGMPVFHFSQGGESIGNA